VIIITFATGSFPRVAREREGGISGRMPCLGTSYVLTNRFSGFYALLVRSAASWHQCRAASSRCRPPGSAYEQNRHIRITGDNTHRAGAAPRLSGQRPNRPDARYRARAPRTGASTKGEPTTCSASTDTPHPLATLSDLAQEGTPCTSADDSCPRR